MWSILIEKLHVVAARLCGVFFCCQIREADWSNRAELSQVRVGPTFSKTHERSQIPNKPETLNTKPPSLCAFCRVCVWEIHDKKGFLPLSGVTWWGDQTAHGIERPKTGMFTFDKERTGKTVWFCQELLTPTYIRKHTLTHTQTRMLVPQIHLRWFKPCPLEGVGRGGGGFHDRRDEKNRAVCNHTHSRNAHLQERWHWKFSEVYIQHCAKVLHPLNVFRFSSVTH